MKTKTLLRHVVPPSAYQLARVLGISRQAISKWQGTVPAARERALRAQFPQWFTKKG